MTCKTVLCFKRPIDTLAFHIFNFHGDYFLFSFPHNKPPVCGVKHFSFQAYLPHWSCQTHLNFISSSFFKSVTERLRYRKSSQISGFPLQTPGSWAMSGQSPEPGIYAGTANCSSRTHSLDLYLLPRGCTLPRRWKQCLVSVPNTLIHLFVLSVLVLLLMSFNTVYCPSH